MWNSQRLTPILRRDISRVEPAKARDQRSRDRRRQSRHAKMDWQFVNTLIPYRDRRRTDQHTRVIGKRKTERQRNCLSGILDNAQRKRWSVTVLHELRKGGR